MGPLESAGGDSEEVQEIAKNLAVNVSGIKELLAALRQIEDRLPREMRIVFNDAARHVVRRAQPRIPERSGRLAASIKPMSTQNTGRVGYGTYNAVPYQGFIEFGGQVGRAGTPRRPFIPKGRYLFPAAEEERGPVINSLEDGLSDLIRRAGLA